MSYPVIPAAEFPNQYIWKQTRYIGTGFVSRPAFPADSFSTNSRLTNNYKSTAKFTNSSLFFPPTPLYWPPDFCPWWMQIIMSSMKAEQAIARSGTWRWRGTRSSSPTPGNASRYWSIFTYACSNCLLYRNMFQVRAYPRPDRHQLRGRVTLVP